MAGIVGDATSIRITYTDGTTGKLYKYQLYIILV